MVKEGKSMHFLALKLTECLVKNKIADSTEMEDCVNGFEMLINKVLVYGSIIMIAAFQDKAASAIIFILFLIGLRARTGGFHANTHLGCFVGSISLYIIVSIVIEPIFLIDIRVLYIAVIISMIVIVLLSPINHLNLNLSPEEMQTCKKSTIWVLIIEVLAIGCLEVIDINVECVIYAALAIVSCAFLMILAKVFKQEIRSKILEEKEECLDEKRD